MASRRSLARTRSWKRRFLLGLLRTAAVPMREILQNYLRSTEGSNQNRSTPEIEMDHFNYLLRTEFPLYEEYNIFRYGASDVEDPEQERTLREEYVNQMITEHIRSLNISNETNDTSSINILELLNDVSSSSQQDLDSHDEIDDSFRRDIAEYLPDFPSLSQETDQDSSVYYPDFQNTDQFSYSTDNTSTHVHGIIGEEDDQETAVGKHLWPCVVCVDKPPETAFTPCSHAACCRECADYVKTRGGCPVCSATVERVDRVYFTHSSCVICMDSLPGVIFKPCCHAVCCMDCTARLLNGDEELEAEVKCPVCKADIDEADVFLLAYS